MRSGVRGTGVSAAHAALRLMCALLLLSSAAVADPGRESDKILCREKLSSNLRTELADKLRQITGWPELKFDTNGALDVGTGNPVGGSSAARDLLSKALHGHTVVFLEDASRRADVIFCRVVRAQWRTKGHLRPPVYVVLVDFADFQMVIGDQPARKAFNVGWGVLHEIDHAINDSTDTEGLDKAGECESKINVMRREVNLPERTDYFFTHYPLPGDSAFSSRFVRLAFDQADKKTGKKKRYWLVWDGALVGGLERPTQIAVTIR